MTHQPGDLIDIASYNNIITSVNTIFGTGTGSSGYGGNSTNVSVTDLPTVASLATIDNQEWLDLRNAQADVATHQGVALPAALPAVVDLENADTIQAFDDQTGPDNPAGEIDSAANLAAIVTNKDLSGGETLSVAIKLINERPSAWSSFIKHEFTVDFGSEDNARFFFNTDGEIRISASRTGGSATTQNTEWSSLVAANSPYNFTQADYFALTTGFVIKQTAPETTVPYTLNNWIIRAKADSIPGVNGGKGSVLRFSSEFTDGHTNIFFDQVDGTFTSTIEERRSTGIFVRPTPTFTTITPLTSGS